MSAPGRKPCPIREAVNLPWGLRFKKLRSKNMPDSLIRQLSFARSDEARRLLLGISK